MTIESFLLYAATKYVARIPRRHLPKREFLLPNCITASTRNPSSRVKPPFSPIFEFWGDEVLAGVIR